MAKTFVLVIFDVDKPGINGKKVILGEGEKDIVLQDTNASVYCSIGKYTLLSKKTFDFQFGENIVKFIVATARFSPTK